MLTSLPCMMYGLSPLLLRLPLFDLRAFFYQSSTSDFLISLRLDFLVRLPCLFFIMPNVILVLYKPNRNSISGIGTTYFLIPLMQRLNLQLI